MSTEQARQPAGSPDGGQFAGSAGAESGTTLAPTSEPIPVVLCEDCAVHQENESPDPDYSNNSTCEECHEAGVDCDHSGHADDDFSDAPCGKCSTTLAGRRVHYAYWGTPEPTRLRGMAAGDRISTPEGDATVLYVGEQPAGAYAPGSVGVTYQPDGYAAPRTLNVGPYDTPPTHLEATQQQGDAR